MKKEEFLSALGGIDADILDPVAESRARRKRIPVRNYVLVAVVAALGLIIASASVTAIVMVVKGDLRFEDGRIIFNRGNYSVDVEPEIQLPGNSYLVENRAGIKTYTDKDGNLYNFNEDGIFVGMTYNPMTLDNSVSMEHKEDPDNPFTDEDSIEAAKKLGHDQFGEVFDRLSFRDIIADSAGVRTVRFWERLGEDGFVISNCFYATFFGDGTLLGYGMPTYANTLDFDDSLLSGVSKQWILSDIDLKTDDQYGDRLIRWYLAADDCISLEKDSSGNYYLSADVIAVLNSENGEEYSDGGRHYEYALPFEGK